MTGWNTEERRETICRTVYASFIAAGVIAAYIVGELGGDPFLRYVERAAGALRRRSELPMIFALIGWAAARLLLRMIFRVQKRGEEKK